MAETRASAVQTIGKSLFGRPVRLALGVSLAESNDAAFYLTEIHNSLREYPMTVVGQVVRR